MAGSFAAKFKEKQSAKADAPKASPAKEIPAAKLDAGMAKAKGMKGPDGKPTARAKELMAKIKLAKGK